jgi:hypothetical protein
MNYHQSSKIVEIEEEFLNLMIPESFFGATNSHLLLHKIMNNTVADFHLLFSEWKM